MYYQIDAADNFFFRGGAPFDAGINEGSRSLFPPFPSVYAGALRACALPDESSDKNTVARTMRIAWNGVLADNRFLFPAPLDRYSKPGEGLVQRVLSVAEDSSYPLPYFLINRPDSEKKDITPSGGLYLDDTGMTQYLQGSEQTLSCRSLADYFDEETHIGIRINSTSRLTEKGHWYQTTRIRPRNCSLVVEAAGIEVPDGAAIRLGGEGKIAYIHRLPAGPALPDASLASEERYFKLYFATPAIFTQGWLPGWIDAKTMTGVFAYKNRRVTLRLLGAATGNPLAAGGFGQRENKQSGSPGPKEMRYAVPAGSVYFFELLQGRAVDVGRLFHRKCLSDYRETLGFQYKPWDRLRYCDRGFGYCLVGMISAEQKGGCLHV